MSKAFDFARSIEGSGSYDGQILPTGSGTGVAGEMRFNTTTGQMEYWSSTSDTPQWRSITKEPLTLDVRYLVIGGGGGGGGYIEGGGGGAGGYRTNFGYGNISGGLSPVESDLILSKNTAYTVSVGAGGAGGTNNASTGYGSRGSDSVFATITSYGGGGGGHYSGVMPPASQLPVGSGGGYPNDFQAAGNGQVGTSGQGFSGGDKTIAAHCAPYSGCGGGGAGAEGGDRNQCSDIPAGGDGLASLITGNSVYRAGGGGAGPYGTGTIGGAGGLGGGGQGGPGDSTTPGTDGTPNTGGGGGGAGSTSGTTGGAGGSGVVILRLPTEFTVTFSSGVTYSSSQVDDDTVYIITATSTASETVTFS